MENRLHCRKHFWHIARITLTLLLSFMLLDVSLAQERTITGVVTDAGGVPLPGVNIVIKGTTTGTVSDTDGKYSLKIPGDETTLVISYVGYETMEVQPGQQISLNISLKEKSTEVDQVVVVGYGSQPKKLVTGATVQVKGEDLEKNHVTRIESALQGITPGMTIIKQNGQPGSEYNITIRGLSSPNSNGPLILIDGVPGTLNTINPEDIESVDVLKDAASAAIYGSRAANGVVLVTSKKGKSGEAVISYDAYYGISNPAKKISLLNAKQYATIMDEAQLNSNPKTPAKRIFFRQGYIDSLGTGTDWLQQITNTNAPSQSHHLGINGGTDKSKYSLSASYSDEDGIYDLENKSNFKRMGIRVNTDSKVKKYLTIGENLTYTHRQAKALGSGNIYGNFLHDILQANPIMTPYDPSTPDGFGVSNFDDKQVNPIASMHYQYNKIDNFDDIVGDAYAELQIMEGLKFRTDFGATLSFNYNSDHTDTFKLGSTDTQHETPIYKQSMKRDYAYNWDNVITYEKTIEKHDIVLMAGMNAEDTWFYSLSGERRGYLSNTAPILTNVTDQLIDTTNGDFGLGDSRYSYFGRLNYAYDEKYLATFTLRRDASSRFGQDKRVGYFPSASVGWIITKEDFMQMTTAFLDFLKLRVSWGQNGKEPPQPFQYLATVGSLNRDYSFGGPKLVGTSPNILSNPSLKWEASTQTNIGFDARFLKNFSFNFDWYDKTSKDWIVQKTVAALSGIGGVSDNLANIKYPFANGGNVTNRGVEFELDYIKNFGDFTLGLKANLSYNRNKVTEVPDSIIHGSGSVLYNGSDEFYRVQSGYPLGYFWGYKTAGIFQDSTQLMSLPHIKGALPGDVIFVDRSGDGKIDPKDKTQIGDPTPKYVYGFNIDASYKGLDISINFQGMAGNDMVQSYRGQDAQTSNYTSDFLNRWTGPNTSNRMPRVTLNNEPNKNWRNFSDLSVQDASFLRLKTVTIGYDLKKLLFDKTTAISQLRFYVSGTNLLTFTKYNGFDPENGYGSYYNTTGILTDAYATGIDLGNYPVARTILFGVNLKF